MIGRLLDGRYQVRSRIARGGMATVYLATDLRLERRVAIKIMHGHLLDDSQFRERFIQEARSAARLAHPNVVNVFDQGQDSDMAYLVMEYLPGITLRDLLQEHRILTTEQTLDIMEAVLGGLAAAHKAGIVHRDLKPENVLLADDGRIKIGDFGLARAASANTATGAALLGTIAYLSPELVTRGIADARSDIYAAGIMMYEMLVGEQPFKGEQPMQIAYQHANEAVPAPSVKNARVPHELDELILWATAREPEARPKDARAMLDQLFEIHSSLLDGLPSTAATSSQRTIVMPTASETGPSSPAVHRGSTAETQVLGGRARVEPRMPVRDNAALLAEKTRQRRRRGIVLLILLIVLALVAGGTGWYFGLGPGSRVTIPDTIAGKSIEEATAILEDLGLEVNPTNGEIDSPTVAVGLVANTSPASIGESVPHGATVQLLISIGPKLITVPALRGITEEQAVQAIRDAPFTLVEPIVRQFDAEVPAGLVIDAIGEDGTSIVDAGQYGELQEVTLVVSAGALPDLTGKTVDEATALLDAVGIEVGAVREDEFSDTVPQGAVIRAVPPDGVSPIRVGDAVDLITSKGVENVLIPDVVGQSWADAKQQLIDAGFELDYNIFADAAPGLFTVSDLTPDGGTLAPKGSTVKVNFSS
jgi:beta-lactam-binding protein with PASTA domain/tRNA A-37 threonylcarbamoyl transferase component Bud32